MTPEELEKMWHQVRHGRNDDILIAYVPVLLNAMEAALARAEQAEADLAELASLREHSQLREQCQRQDARIKDLEAKVENLKKKLGTLPVPTFDPEKNLFS